MKDTTAPAATPATPDDAPALPNRIADPVDSERLRHLDQRAAEWADTEGYCTTVGAMVTASDVLDLVAEVRRARAAPAPGTATREEFERLVQDYGTSAMLWADDATPQAKSSLDAARAVLLQYEQRLRGRAERLKEAGKNVLRAWDRYSKTFSSVHCEAEDATWDEWVSARVAHGEAMKKFRSALVGVPTSAADGGGHG